MTHELKILPKWFEDVKLEKKNFEIRRADRDFKVGDTLVLKEYEKGRYTGREIERTIQYIYKGDGTYGVSEEFWILGLKTIEGEQMTNKEAIERIQSIKSKVSLYDDVLALRMAEEALENQTSVITELEKIKAEIQEQIDFFKKIESFANAYGLEIANGIIKCRIAELKGE